MSAFKDWLITFGMIIIKPVPDTFLEESKKAKGKLPGVIAWVVFATCIAHLSIYLNFHYVYSLGTIILTIIVFPVILLFFVFCVHRLYQRSFHRNKDYYQELLYIMVGIFVPIFGIMSSLISLIPQIGEAFSIILSVYSVFLAIIAVKAITKLKLWQAGVSVVVGFVLAAAGVLVIPAILLSLMSTIPRVF